MGRFARLVDSHMAILAFKAKYHILRDIEIAFYTQDAITKQRVPGAICVSLIASNRRWGYVSFYLSLDTCP